MHRKVYQAIYIGLGFIFLGIGAIGVVLPILPTTPFLLVASFFFAKGSTRFHQWFLSTRLYKNHLHDFVQTRAMTLKTKLCILLPVSAMLTIAFVLAPIWHAQVVIAFLFCFKYYYFFFRIKTIATKERVS